MVRDDEMILDCAVIGGGPAGLNASLVLGRSWRKTILFAAAGSMAAMGVNAALIEETFS